MPLPPPKPELYIDSDCTICHEPLLIPSSHEPLVPSYEIDDVQLQCSHHFHKSCLLEYAVSSPDARERCALCRANVLDSSGVFIVTVRTETGYIGTIDIGREIDDQLYFQAHPDAERAQVFLSLMSQMEFDEAEKMLKGEDGLGKGKRLSPNVTYETGQTTAMHMAALNDDVEGVRLLLRYGADPLLQDENKQTALQMARDQDARKVIPLLASASDQHMSSTDR
ncbi:MAG: hypothetical protein ASARMPREDX12_008560 [Alectoria sarmentosa]|nr:MAG: hypothetical protein ASARMPRED_007814 [Alectoria sarmentosa]CAD6577912.1 MAG: hypothetical protein ASARMPREDX12_008560 [Alectoria sarmentosa]